MTAPVAFALVTIFLTLLSEVCERLSGRAGGMRGL